MQITVTKPTEEQLKKQSILSWPIWEKEVSTFGWRYDQTEVCYFLDGEVEVEIAGGKKVSMGKGDLVTFPKGLECTWCIKSDVRKHYNFF